MNQDDRGGNKKAAARGGMRLLRLLATAQDSYLVGAASLTFIAQS
jgi:hypothetical protein